MNEWFTSGPQALNSHLEFGCQYHQIMAVHEKNIKKGKQQWLETDLQPGLLHGLQSSIELCCVALLPPAGWSGT